MNHAHSPGEPRGTPTLGDLKAALGMLLAMRCGAVRNAPARLGALDAALFGVQAALTVALQDQAERRRSERRHAPAYVPRLARPFAETTSEPMPTQFAGRSVRGDTLLATIVDSLPPALAEPNSGRTGESLLWAGLRAAGRP